MKPGSGSQGRMWRLRGIVVASVTSAMLASGAAGAAQSMSQAEVNDTLRNTQSIYNGLYLAAIIYEIVQQCEELRGPNRLERTAYLLGLYNQARRMGFSRDQIEGFIEDDVEKARMDALVRNYIESRGARLDDPASVCALGRNEMAAGTPVGERLRER